jgi:quinol monooxygenase YgiN
MRVVHVDIHVIQGAVEEFKHACVENATASLEEPGVVRFDFVQRVDAPERFLLIEVYRDAEAAAAHKQTSHYARWRDTVGPMMAEPRSSQKYHALFPDEAGWETVR